MAETNKQMSLREQRSETKQSATNNPSLREQRSETKQSAYLIPQLRFKEFEGEWERKKLGEVSRVITGSTPSTSNKEYYDGNKLFVSPADIQGNRFISETKTTLTDLGFSKGRKVKKNSVLFVCIGSTIGKVGQLKEDSLTNQQINALEAKKNNSNDFIYSLLELNGKKIKKLAGVQAVPQINKTDFSNFRFYFPNLPEQQKIASFLTSVDTKIQQLTRKKQLLETYKKGAMQQLFSQKLRFKDENGKEFPKWEEKKLGEIVSLLKDGTHGTHQDDPKGKYLLLSAKNIRNGRINIDYDDRKISENEFNSIYKNYNLQKDDILLTIIGTIGRVAKYNNEHKVAFQRSVAFFRFENYNSDFMAQLMEGRNFQKELEKRKVISAQPGIYLGDLSKIHLLIPSLKEQQKIANYLAAIDTKIESVSKQIMQTQTFKKGLLQQLFV